jgi:threonine/homoserine/homoserine lactone efflux protein
MAHSINFAYGRANSNRFSMMPDPGILASPTWDVAMPLHHYLPYLAAAWSVYFVAVVSPGPAVVALINTSMTKGRKAGMAFATGIMTGSLVWASLSAIGLAALIAAYAELLVVIKIAGGLYLLYLAWKAFRSAASGDEALRNTSGIPETLGRLYLKGFLLHLTNPKAIFIWISLVSLGLPTGAPASIMIVYIVGCLSIGLLSLNAMAMMFSTSPVVAGYRRARRYIEATMGAFFAFAGVKMLTTQV